MRSKDAFLVNLWIERGDGEKPAAWRGSVEHVASGRRLYFNEIAILTAFLFDRLGRRDPARRAELRANAPTD
jgi:hypothetical protein